MWNFSTLFLRLSQHNILSLLLVVDTDSTKGFNNKLFSCLPYHIWHVNKLNFKYFFSPASAPSFLPRLEIYKIFTEHSLNKATVFFSFLSTTAANFPKWVAKCSLARDWKKNQKKRLQKNKTPNELFIHRLAFADDAFNRSSEWRLNENLSFDGSKKREEEFSSFWFSFSFRWWWKKNCYKAYIDKLNELFRKNVPEKIGSGEERKRELYKANMEIILI